MLGSSLRLSVPKRHEAGMHVLSLPPLLFLWVFLPFPADLEPYGQFQRPLMEDQKSQSCSGTCQPRGQGGLEVPTTGEALGGFSEVPE